MTIDSNQSSVKIESISPEPDSGQRAAIEQAIGEVWPKPTAVAEGSTLWRFSGRPWSRESNRFRP